MQNNDFLKFFVGFAVIIVIGLIGVIVAQAYKTGGGDITAFLAGFFR